MNKFLGILLLLVVTGCTTVIIPNYIYDKHPVQQIFYAPYEAVYAATIKALKSSGWKIAEESDPALFERRHESEDTSRSKTVIFTQIRQLSFFVGSGYSRLNVFLNVTVDKATEVEIRYVKVTTIGPKTFNNFKNDKLVNRLLKRIEENLELVVTLIGKWLMVNS